MTISSKIKISPPAKTTVKAIKRVTAPLKTTLTKTTAAKKAPPKAPSKPVFKPLSAIAKLEVATQVNSPISKPIKAKKIKLVRDSFTIPKPEYLILDNLKLRAADLKHPVKKSELLRAGIKALAAMTDVNLLAALKAVPILKSGRPSK